VVIGTSGGNIYKIMGSSGGLQLPGGAFASPGGSISGVKFADCYSGTKGPGLEVVASTGAMIYIYKADATSGSVIITIANPPGSSAPGSETIRSLAAGDVDGDRDDDIVVGTVDGHIYYWRNNAGAWVSPTPNPDGFNLGTAIDIFDIDLGDVSNSKYLGR